MPNFYFFFPSGASQPNSVFSVSAPASRRLRRVRTRASSLTRIFGKRSLSRFSGERRVRFQRFPRGSPRAEVRGVAGTGRRQAEGRDAGRRGREGDGLAAARVRRAADERAGGEVYSLFQSCRSKQGPPWKRRYRAFKCWASLVSHPLSSPPPPECFRGTLVRTGFAVSPRSLGACRPSRICPRAPLGCEAAVC